MKRFLVPGPTAASPAAPPAASPAAPPAAAPAPPAARLVPAAPGDEQNFIDYFAARCKHPARANTFVMSRKVAVFGKRHGHGLDVTRPLEELPASFVAFAAQNNYNFNSVTCNLYEETKSSIAWHSDAPDALAEPEVISLSFAIRRKDRGKKLAAIEFRWPSLSGGARQKEEPLFHGAALRFDARKHKKLRCEHRVPATLRPRLNVTLRVLK